MKTPEFAQPKDCNPNPEPAEWQNADDFPFECRFAGCNSYAEDGEEYCTNCLKALRS